MIGYKKNNKFNIILNHIYGDYYDEACQEAIRLSEEQGCTFIHPFDDIDIITGQATIALEILNNLPETDVILVPVGGA